MKKNGIQLYYWLKNIFVFSKPNLVLLKYVDCVFDNKAYLLIQWQFSKAYRITIKELKYTSFRKSASAYINISGGIEKIKVEISNCWKTEIRYIHLKRTVLSFETDYQPKTNFGSFNNAKIKIEAPEMNKKVPTIKEMNLKVKNYGENLKLKNLTYPF